MGLELGLEMGGLRGLSEVLGEVVEGKSGWRSGVIEVGSSHPLGVADIF